MPNGVVTDPHVFVSIAPDGTVTIVAHRSEMGTGSRTSLPMVIADEMEADWARVKIVQAPGDEPKYGNQDTDGSRSMRHHIQSMRQIGADGARDAEGGGGQAVGRRRRARSRRSTTRSCTRRRASKLGYGDLAQAVAEMEVPAEQYSNPTAEPLPFKDESEFRYIGKGKVPIYDLHDITTGKAVYGADVQLPGMKYAAVARPPVVGGKVKSVDDSAAKAVAGRRADRADRGQHAAGQVRAARRRRGGRRQHLGRAPGPRRAQDRVGRRPARRPTTPSSTTRRCRRPRPSPAR